MIDPNYIPFGEEWKQEISKLPKKMLIEMLRKALIEKIQLLDEKNVKQQKPLL